MQQNHFNAKNLIITTTSKGTTYMRNLSILDILSILFTLISVFICYTTMFTNLYNESGFSFWYFPGATFFVISIIVNILGMFRNNKSLNISLFFVNFFVLLIFTTPFAIV
ncbi:hypothetical protein [Staphylococcus capitis]|uniref:hypothetical protein n=1 Tax=Staphylococcus capitis TaxID=29388 RepID=UPI001D177452|nr:hypothetical protein [Staphylococcus capitis]